MKPLRHDDRGLAIGIVLMVATLVLGALLYVMFQPAMDVLFATAKAQAQTQQATDVINRRERIWGAFLIFASFLSLVFIIARATAESEGVR